MADGAIPHEAERLQAVEWFEAQGRYDAALLSLKRTLGRAPSLYAQTEHVEQLLRLYEKLGAHRASRGAITGIQPPTHYDYKSRRDTPNELRAYFRKLGWRRVVASPAPVRIVDGAQGFLLVANAPESIAGPSLDAEVGLMARAERVVLIGGSALFFGLNWNGLVLKAVIFILAVLTNITAIQRILWVYRHGAGVPLDAAGKGPARASQAPAGAAPMETIASGAEASTEEGIRGRS